MALLLGPIVLTRLLPSAWKHSLSVKAANASLLAVLTMAAFGVIDTGLVGLVTVRFRRSRLISG